MTETQSEQMLLEKWHQHRVAANVWFVLKKRKCKNMQSTIKQGMPARCSGSPRKLGSVLQQDSATVL